MNNDGRTALSVASCPNNPCTNPELESVVKLLSGELPLDQTVAEVCKGEGASKGLFKPGQERIVSVKIKAPSKPASMSGEEPATSTDPAANKEDDVYEFKTSKESTPNEAEASTAAPATTVGGGGGEKRAKEEDGPDDEADARQKKKRKEDTASGAGRGRGVRGNSSEKTVGGKAVGRGRGANTQSSSADRKSPSSNSREAASPAPSPGKNKTPKQDEESDSDGDKKDGPGPKVPPLKIVLTSGQNNREEDKKKNYSVSNGSEDGESSEGKTEGAESSTGEAEKGGRAERVTRSRKEQGGEEEDSQEGPAKEETRQGTDNEYHFKKRKLRGQQGEEQNNSNGGFVRPSGEPLTDIEKHLNIRKQIEQRRKNLFPVQPKPPQGFKDYLMNKKTYHLEGNTGKDPRIQPIAKIAPPPSLEGALRDLFLTQENERYKLRMKHLVEKEKLVLAVEQEILRVHGRAARALANQSLPYSVCTILRDEEVS